MKFSIFNNSFWGVALILFGGLLLIKYIFGLYIPVGRIFFASIIILIGVQMLMGGFHFRRGKNSAMFSESRFIFNNESKEYNVAFGSGKLDLSEYSFTKDTELKCKCAFGEFNIKLPSDTTVFIDGNVAFGSLETPDRNQTSFGNCDYKNESKDADAPKLHIKSELAFGSMNFFY